MRKGRTVFKANIVDLIQVGSIHQYLCQNWMIKDIYVEATVQKNGDFSKMEWLVNNPQKIKQVDKFIKDFWQNHKLHLVITERPK